MKRLINGAALFCIAAGLIACDSNSESDGGFSGSEHITVTVNHEVEAFSRLSYEAQVQAASALLVVRYEHDESGQIVPVITHRKSRLGSDLPPYQVGDVYMSPTQQFLVETAEGDLRHLSEGAVILFRGEPPQEGTSSFISDDAIMGESPVAVDAVLAGFDGAPIANGMPAEVLTLEPDLSKGETGQAKVTVTIEEKDILVDILERRGLRHEIIIQNDEYIVGWVGRDEDMQQVMDEFDAACE